jgi:hypothetical protein
MNATTEALARDKEILIARCALTRLRLRLQVRDLRDSLGWKRTALALATTPAMRRIAFGIGLSIVGLGRAARMVLFASRVVLVAKLASSLIGRLK